MFLGFRTEISRVPFPSAAAEASSSSTQWKLRCLVYGSMRTTVPGGPLMALLLSLMAWHSAHHLRHFALDIGLKRFETALTVALYGLAALTTLASFVAAARLLA